MEWRIILPVLCLIGILHLPGYVVSQGTTTTTVAPTTVTTATTTPTTVTTATTTPTTVTTATTTPTTVTTATTTPTTVTTATTTPTTATTATTPTTATTATTPTTATTVTTPTTASTAAGSSSTGGSTAATTTAPLPRFIGLVNLNFKINDTFQAAYSDLNNPVTILYVNDLKTKLNQAYKNSYPNYYGLIVNQLSPGSIIANTSLQYDTSTSPVPNAVAVRDTLIQAISNGTLGLSIDNTSIAAVVLSSNASSTTASPIATTQTTTAATTPLALTNYTFNFKIPGNFISDLSNINSIPAFYLKTFVNYQLSGFLGNFRGYQAVDVWRFRNGSINIDAWVTFAKNLSPPNITEVAKQLAAAVRNNTFLLPIDPTSINVTDILTGTTANKSPVMVSMLTALWMTLASLLFSAVIH